MSNEQTPITVLEAIIFTIKKSPRKQATLKELYDTVPKLLEKNVNGTTIRGVINRSLETSKKQGLYPILFKRVSEGTYALIGK